MFLSAYTCFPGFTVMSLGENIKLEERVTMFLSAFACFLGFNVMFSVHLEISVDGEQDSIYCNAASYN